MKIEIDNNLIKIFKDITQMDLSIQEWREIESCDMFQNKNYCGGFDADEDEFTFSLYLNNTEYWFQISLDKINKILKKEIKCIDIYPRSEFYL